MLVKQILISLIVIAVPQFVVSKLKLPDNLGYFILGLAIGIDLGWWGYHCFCTQRALAVTAQRAEENAEKQRQWERDRIDRKEAEEKAEKEAIKEAMKDVPPIVVAPFKSQFDGY
jgi:hypothetical protein